MKIINLFIKISTASFFLFFGLFFSVAFASGSIDSSNYSAQICENVGCTVTSTSPVNFGYFTTASSSNITVSDTSLSGYMWGSSLGWVVLNCSLTTSGCSATNGNFKVSNTNGTLSGYGWGETAGWVNFGPFTGSATSPITINTTTGEFNGYAWSQNFGWIKFDCSDPSYCTKTTWAPPTTTTTTGTFGSYPKPTPQIAPVPTVPSLIPDTPIPNTEPKGPPGIPSSSEEDIPTFEFPVDSSSGDNHIIDTSITYIRDTLEEMSEFSFSEFLRGWLNHTKESFANLVKKIQELMTYVPVISFNDFVFAVISIVSDYFQYMIMVFAFVLLVWLLLLLRPKAFVVNKDTMEPFNSGRIIFSKIDTGKIVKTVNLSHQGSYHAFLKSGVYIARVEEKQQDGSMTCVHTSEPIHLSTGFVKNTLFV